MIQEWMEETHSTGFALRRHFFLRSFDSQFVTMPDQLAHGGRRRIGHPQTS